MPAQMSFDNAASHEPSSVYAMDKEEIRSLQKHLGFEPCFRTAKLLTCTTDCEWRHHCRRPVAEWQREW